MYVDLLCTDHIRNSMNAFLVLRLPNSFTVTLSTCQSAFDTQLGLFNYTDREMGAANVSSMSYIAEIDDPEPPPCGSGARDALLAVMTAEIDAGVYEVTHLIDNGVVGATTGLILCLNATCTAVPTLFSTLLGVVHKQYNSEYPPKRHDLI